MTKWLDRYENNEVHSTIEETSQLIDTLIEDQQDNSSVTSELNRIQQVLDFVSKRLKKCDPNLVAISTLNSLNKTLTNINSELTTFQSNNTDTHLNSANTHADTVLTQLSTLPLISSVEDVDNIRESIVSFRRSAAQNLRHFENEVEAKKGEIQNIHSKLNEFGEEIKSQKGRLDEAITNFQQQYSESENKRRDSSAASISKAQAEFDELKESYTAAFEEIKTANEETVEKLEGQLTDAIENGNKQFRDSTSDLVKCIEKHRDDAERLVHVIGNTGMVGGYQKVANQKRNAARMWKGVTFVALGGLIGFAIYAITLTSGETIDWGVFSARIFVATTFGILAAYGARQGDRNDRLEANHRRVELELASINPYLADFPDEKQKEIKEELAKRMFGKIDTDFVSGKEGEWNGTALDLLKLALKTLGDVAKSK